MYQFKLYISFFFHLFNQSLQAKLSFSSKEIVALSCAWCKSSYHNKEACFNPHRIGEECTLGKSLCLFLTTQRYLCCINFQYQEKLFDAHSLWGQLLCVKKIFKLNMLHYINQDYIQFSIYIYSYTSITYVYLNKYRKQVYRGGKPSCCFHNNKIFF